mgnify:FL=1
MNRAEHDVSKLLGKENPKYYYTDAYATTGPCIRSVTCTRLITEDMKLCTACKTLQKSDQFVHTLKRSSQNKTQNFTNDKYLSRRHLLSRIKKLRKQYAWSHKKVMILHTSFNEVKRQKTKLSHLIAEATTREDTKSIVYNLRNAYKKGYLSDKSTVLQLVRNVTANLNRKGHGKRYDSLTEQFYEALLIIGGPRVAKFVADNMNGPGK